MKPEDYDWMDEARGAAAECWCDPDTMNIVSDPALCEAVAKRIAVWMLTAAQNQRNTDYYRGLLKQCGKIIGARAFTADDGTRTDNVLCAKIPEIIENDYTNGKRRCSKTTRSLLTAEEIGKELALLICRDNQELDMAKVYNDISVDVTSNQMRIICGEIGKIRSGKKMLAALELSLDEFSSRYLVHFAKEFKVAN